LEGLLRFKVPQNIDMQDRIVGPLTVLQFIYAVLGFSATYGLFMKVPSPFNFFLAVPVGLFTLAVVFVKINEQPFLKFVSYILTFLSLPKRRIWQQINDVGVKVQINHLRKDNKPDLDALVSHEDISALASKVDASRQSYFPAKK
jgi:hypothetical protein